MPAAVPLIAVVAGAVGSAAVGGGIIGALVGAGAAIGVTLIGQSVFLGDKLETELSFAGLVRVDRHLGHADQAANGNLIAETGGKWTAEHRGRGRAYLALRLKLRPEAFPSGPPNVAAIVEGADTILDPRTGAIGWSDNPALCLAWYLTAPFGWKAAWEDIDLPALIAAANICDEIVGRKDGTAERRYTVMGGRRGRSNWPWTFTPCRSVRRLECTAS